MRAMPRLLAAVSSLAAVASLAGYATAAASQSHAPASARSSPWVAEHSGTHQRLLDIACLTALRCVAVGEGGTILATGNGGRTWRPQASHIQAPVSRIACAGPATCYAIARPATILVTHDGGAHWRASTLAIPGVGASDTVPGCTIGTMSAPALERPCDVGLLDISCPSARVCYAVATGPAGYTGPSSPPASSPPGSTIWITRDSGASWTTQPIPLTLGCTNGDCGMNVNTYPLTWVTCLSNGLCRAGGEEFLGCGHCGFLDAVFSTTGPSAPWKQIVCPHNQGTCSALLAPDVATCPRSAVCYGAYGSNPFAGSEARDSVFRSADGGYTWPASDPGTRQPRNDIACPTAFGCYTAGGGGWITRVGPGSGLTLTSRPEPRVTFSSLNGITCLSSALCYAVGDNGTILARLR